MNTQFHTNIDCMKKFMSHISGLSIVPNVGDIVEVYKDSRLSVELQVEQRRWTFINGAQPTLHCELHLPKHRWDSLAHFIKVMKDNNIT